MRTDWLTGYGPSNLETLLILIAMAVLLVGVWLWIRHRWRNEADQMESAIAEAGHNSAISFGVSWVKQSASVANSKVNSPLPRQRDEQLQCELTEAQAQRKKHRASSAAAQRQIEQLQREVNEVRAQV